jgi:hypothetical protein
MNKELKKIRLAYKNMLDRCYNQNNFQYANYGGRGIKVCKQWLNSREAFVSWSLANGHADGLSLDRKNNNAGYSPSNCRWVSIEIQLTNQRRDRRLTFEGRTQTVSQWAAEIGVSQDTIHKRLVRGLPTEKALTPGRLRSWSHGTRAGYEGHGCRCDACRESNNARHRERRAMKQSLGETK